MGNFVIDILDEVEVLVSRSKVVPVEVDGVQYKVRCKPLSIKALAKSLVQLKNPLREVFSETRSKLKEGEANDAVAAALNSIVELIIKAPDVLIDVVSSNVAIEGEQAISTSLADWLSSLDIAVVVALFAHSVQVSNLDLITKVFIGLGSAASSLVESLTNQASEKKQAPTA